MHPFRAAIEARDVQAAAAVLADDVVFHSPIAFKPYVGRSATGAVLAAVLRVFDDFAYERESTSADGRDHALMFRARVDGKDIQGCDFLRHDQDGAGHATHSNGQATKRRPGPTRPDGC